MMAEDDPFGDTTIIRPNPGGRLSAPAEKPASAPAPVGEGPFSVAILDANPGISPLMDAAAPILALVSKLAVTLTQDDVEGLRRRVRAEFAAFEKRAASLELKPGVLRACHYALCATVDDVASNMPWGANNVWADQSMARIFHTDTSGGESFFHLLNHFERDPETYGEVLELFYFCASLGFQGRFRILPEGAAEIAALRGRLYRLMRRRRGEVAAELSPHWQGIAAPHRPLTSYIPLWVMGLGLAVLLLLIFTAFSLALGNASGVLYAKLSALPGISKPQIRGWEKPLPPPPPPPPTIARLLEPEIRDGLLTVQETEQAVTIRLRGATLFASGSASLQDRYLPTIDRVATALKTVQGSLSVIGHTDNQPIHNLRFPSNFELSLARAEAVRDRMLTILDAPDRITVDGRADREPIADNATPEGREANRRIDLILLRSGART
jgi:type VI secretion system protein ImpK